MSGERADIAFFLPTLGGGGAERVMIDLAQSVAARGRRVDVVVLNRTDAAVEPPGGGVRVVDLGARRAATALPALLRYLRGRRPPVLLSTLEHVNVLAVVAARWVGGIRVVLREANTYAADLAGVGAKDRLVRAAMRRTYRSADAVVAVSNGVANGLIDGLGVPPDRVHVIFNPVITPRVEQGGRASSPEHPWFASGEPPVVLAVGRLVRQKGFDVLLRAFAVLHERRPCRLMVLGEGPLRGGLEDLAREVSVEPDVAFPGFVDDPFPYMASADLFVLSSRWEGLPNVLIQAMAVGAPVVATDCPSGPREILDAGRYGRLVQVDDVAALAEAMGLELERRSERPGEAWRRRYALDSVTEAYLEVLEATSSRQARSGR